MPPEQEARPSLLFTPYFQMPDVWKWVLDSLDGKARSWLRRPPKELREIHPKITDGISSTEEKIAAIFNYCRTNFRNRNLDARQFTDAELANLKDNSSLSDLLKRKYGTTSDITILFVALARAAGYEAHMAYCNDTRDRFFSEADRDPRLLLILSALDGNLAAVKINGEWRLYEPGAIYQNPGQLAWYHEGTHALIVTGESNTEWIITPVATADCNKRIQNGTFTLDTDGTLEGDANIEYTGHIAARFRHEFDGETDEDQIKILTDRIKDKLPPGAEITNLDIRGLRYPENPLTLSCHIRSPHYAESTGQRLFLSPAFFQKGDKPYFPDPARKFYIRFPFPWTEESKTTIALPEGFTMEQGTAPLSLPADKSFAYKITAAFKPSTRELFYTRDFSFNHVLVRNDSYPVVKRIFDHIHQQDAHNITLKRSSTPTTTAATSTDTPSNP